MNEECDKEEEKFVILDKINYEDERNEEEETEEQKKNRTAEESIDMRSRDIMTDVLRATHIL